MKVVCTCVKQNDRREVLDGQQTVDDGSLVAAVSALEQRVGKGYEGEPHKLLQI